MAGITEYLTPPLISEASVLKRLVCIRPKRHEQCNISLEKVNAQTIVHCYGHGGSGWSNLFGSIDMVITLVQQASINKQTPIRIIGAGCMGLTAAIELTRQGFHVAGITAQERIDLPSWRATGCFVAMTPRHESLEKQAFLRKIAIKTFLTYQEIEKGCHPYIPADAVRRLPVYASAKTGNLLELLEKEGLVTKPQEVSINFGNGVTHTGLLKYMTYFMNTTILMKQLTAQVAAMNIPIEIRKINSFDEVNESVIINCSGIGARELNNDEKVVPMRGHLMVLNTAAGTEHLNYMISTKIKKSDSDEYIFLMPKTSSVTSDALAGIDCAGIIGATFIAHTEHLSPEELQRRDDLEFRKLLDRASLFFSGRHPLL